MRKQMVRVGVALTAVGATLLAGVALASATSTPETFSACVKQNGSLYDLVVNGTPTCSNHERTVTWNQQGEAGPAGAQGPPGPQGEPGAQGSQGSAGPAAVQGGKQPHRITVLAEDFALAVDERMVTGSAETADCSSVAVRIRYAPESPQRPVKAQAFAFLVSDVPSFAKRLGHLDMTFETNTGLFEGSAYLHPRVGQGASEAMKQHYPPATALVLAGRGTAHDTDAVLVEKVWLECGR